VSSSVDGLFRERHARPKPVKLALPSEKRTTSYGKFFEQMLEFMWDRAAPQARLALDTLPTRGFSNI
jgi:hypothetical protein